MLRLFSYLVILGTTFIALEGCSFDKQQGQLQGSPLDNLPAHISVLTDYGMRADFSPDQKGLIFLNALIGEVHYVDLESKAIKSLTSHYPNYGYTRALYLSNGDILLCGAKKRKLETGNPDEGRHEGIMWILQKPFTQAAIPLDEKCWEGPAISRSSLKIAWTRSNMDTHANDVALQILMGYSEIWLGDINYDENNMPSIQNKTFLLNRSSTSLFGMIEPQNFRPPLEDELIFTTYLKGTSDSFGVDIKSKKVINYTHSIWYEEAEGIFSDGMYTTVEKDWSFSIPPQTLDIWKVKLDGSGDSERLTFFNRYDNFGASNPVISDEGQLMAFQVRQDIGLIGNGEGILLFDLLLFEDSKNNLH